MQSSPNSVQPLPTAPKPCWLISLLAHTTGAQLLGLEHWMTCSEDQGQAIVWFHFVTPIGQLHSSI